MIKRTREILFRGKRTDNGEWVEGYYTLYANNRGVHPCILTGTEQGCVIPVFVIPETVGQFTGLTDRKGKKIFEDDIAMFDGSDIVYIGFVDGVYRLFNKNGYYTVSVHNHYAYIEIIGNIHDNPELLEREAK